MLVVLQSGVATDDLVSRDTATKDSRGGSLTACATVLWSCSEIPLMATSERGHSSVRYAATSPLWHSGTLSSSSRLPACWGQILGQIFAEATFCSACSAVVAGVLAEAAVAVA